MQVKRWFGVALAMLAAMSSPDAAAPQAEWIKGEQVPRLRLPDIRFPEGLEPGSVEAARARTIDLGQFRGKPLLLLEFASW